MAQPFNYNVQPSSSLLGNLQGLTNLGGVIQQQKYAAHAFEQQQQQAAASAAYKQKMQQAQRELISNPTAQGFVDFSVAYPELSEETKRSSEMFSDAQKQSSYATARDVYSSLSTGNPEVAKGILASQLEAATNSGDAKQQAILEAQLRMIDETPRMAKVMAMQVLNGTKDGQDFLKSQADVESTQAGTGKANAERRKIESALKFADVSALNEIVQAGGDAVSLVEAVPGLSKDVKRFAVLSQKAKNAKDATAREKAQLQIDQLKDEMAMKVNERQYEVRSAVYDLDTFNSSIDRILPGFETSAGEDSLIPSSQTIAEAATGSIEGRSFVPTIRQNVRDWELLVENLDDQAFIANIKKVTGLGALSNAEGATLRSYLGNLSLEQSPEQMRDTMMKMKNLIEKARTNLQKKYGDIPVERINPHVAPTTPAGEIDPRYSGAVMQHLQRYGG